MCGRELVTGCTDELEYSKIHLITVGAQLNAPVTSEGIQLNSTNSICAAVTFIFQGWDVKEGAQWLQIGELSSKTEVGKVQ